MDKKIWSPGLCQHSILIQSLKNKQTLEQFFEPLYSAVVAQKKADESDTINEFEAGGKVAELELEAAADFTVCPSPICLRKGKIIKLKILLGSQNCSNEKQTLTNPLTKSLRVQLNYLFKFPTHHSPKT